MLARPRHPSKAIEEVVQYAESIDWRWNKLTGHGWGELLCPQSDRDGCRVLIYTTPRNAELSARTYMRAVKRCDCTQKEKCDEGA